MAWLPALTAVTPCASLSAGRFSMTVSAPRGLKVPVNCSSSSLRNTSVSPPARAAISGPSQRCTGVSRTRSPSRARAAAISSTVGLSVGLALMKVRSWSMVGGSMPVLPQTRHPAPRQPAVAAIGEALEALGLALRGGFHPEPRDGVPALPDGRPVATLLLAGTIGSRWWGAFATAPEAADGLPDPLDRWSRRLLAALAEMHGAAALFPFGGPPYLPFPPRGRAAQPGAPAALGRP